MQDEEIPNLEDALSSLATEVLEEQSNPSQDNMQDNWQNQVAGSSAKMHAPEVDSLRSQERTLLRIDRLLISGGIRFVLFLPLIVVVNFGLAHSYRNTTPQWWLDHMQEVAPVEMHLGIHFLSLTRIKTIQNSLTESFLTCTLLPQSRAPSRLCPCILPRPTPPPIAIDLFVRLWEHVITGWTLLPARLPVVSRGLHR